MNREQAIDYIVHNAKSILTPDGSGKGYVCEICGSGKGPKGTGMTTEDDIHFTCWAHGRENCPDHSDIIDIIGAKHNLSDFNEKLQAAAYEMGVIIDESDLSRPVYYKKSDGSTVPASAPKKEEEPPEEYTEFFLSANKDLDKTDYYRGISFDTLNRFKVGYVEKWKLPLKEYLKKSKPERPRTAETWEKLPCSPRLIIPTSRYSYLARDTRATLTEAQEPFKKQKTGKLHTFNKKALTNATQPIFVLEGEINALSIIDVGGEAVGIGTTKRVKAFCKEVTESKCQQPFVIAFDNDTAGNTATETLKNLFENEGISYTILDDFLGENDANDALIKDREAFSELVRMTSENAEDIAMIDLEEKEAKLSTVYDESAAADIEAFRASIRASESAKCYPSGFYELDKILDGGFYEGLYFIGAISSLGKTTFCLQMADQIAQSGNDVLIFSLEMAKKELMAKSISRLTYINTSTRKENSVKAKTTRGILTGRMYSSYSEDEINLINEAIEEYSYYASHIYISEGIGNIGVEEVKERINAHIEKTGNRPFVLIDYLQILAPLDARSSDKQNTDKAVLELKRLSRDLHIPILGISSFNRDNYTEPVNTASFKESGAIEYSSDVLLGLQYEGMDFQQVTKIVAQGRKDEHEKTGPESEQDRKLRVFKLLEEQAEKARNGEPQQIEVKILKNRNGDRGSIQLDFLPRYNYFVNSEKEIELDDDGMPW